MVDAARLAPPSVVHGLHAVAVRIDEKRPVVVLAVLRTRPRCPVVRIAGFCADAPELLDDRPGRREEGDVQPAGDRLLPGRLGEREVAPLRVRISAERLLETQ